MPDDTRARQEISSHYESGYEAQRLAQGTSRLELARTQELLERYLPPRPAVVLDVGGGPGVYAFWLAQKGYTVHLLDAMPVHIEQARAASEHSATPLASLRVGDARELPFADASADLVLMLGPLYHLTERDDRIHALREGQRVLRAGGRLVAAAISRFTSTTRHSCRSRGRTCTKASTAIPPTTRPTSQPHFSITPTN
jgi:ubiquinone/menaquinone biosynthesis C-methylase UbiE